MENDRNELHVADLDPYKYYTIWLPDSIAEEIDKIIELYPDKYISIGDVIRSTFGEMFGGK